jgi:hypothetical protein
MLIGEGANLNVGAYVADIVITPRSSAIARRGPSSGSAGASTTCAEAAAVSYTEVRITGIKG